jgi:O-antigen/teichoic acid export membrane protein
MWPRLHARLQELRQRKFVRDTLVLQASSLVSAGANLAGTVLLAHLIGPGAQGQYYLALSLYALLFFALNQGLQGAAVSQIASARARGLDDKASAWLGFLLKSYALVGLALLLLGALLLPMLGPLMRADETSTRLALLLTLTPLLELPKVVLTAGLQGTRQMLALARIENGTEVLRMFLIGIGALYFGDASGAIYGTLAASAVASLLALHGYASARAKADFLPGWREIVGHARDVPLKKGLPLAFKLGLTRSVDAIGTQALPTLILNFVSGSTAAVAYLRIAQRLLSVPLLLMQGISRNLLPKFSELAGLRDMERFRREFARTVLISGALISAGVLAAMPLLSAMVGWIFPLSYHEPVRHMAWILVPGFLVMSFSVANDIFYLVTNTLLAGMLICIAGLVFNALAVWYLAWVDPFYGVAVGLSLTYASAALHYLYEWWWFRRSRRAQG